jgi:hypothetical protein
MHMSFTAGTIIAYRIKKSAPTYPPVWNKRLITPIADSVIQLFAVYSSPDVRTIWKPKNSPTSLKLKRICPRLGINNA